MARKILLADDSVTAQNMGRKILADAGYEVITVNNGSAALKKIGEQRPDLIVLDVYMPGYSGLEVCQRLKEVGDSARIPILLTVGKLEPFKPEEAKRVRADGFIVKPFEASELLSALSKLEDKIVPRPEPSKPGRFARATAAIEESRRDKAVADEEDSGWRNRISFPSRKKKEKEVAAEEDSDDQAIYNPVNKDLRTVIEHHEGAHKDTVAEDRVDLGALTPEGLPKDVTPEEIAALAAAAAQIQGRVEESKSPEPVQELAVTPPVEPGTENPQANQPIALADSAPEAVATPTPAVTFAEQSAEQRTDSTTASVEAPSIATPESVPSTAAVVPEMPVDEPVTMAAAAGAVSGGVASRWTAVAVALAPEESGISLEQEMQSASAVLAAAEISHGEATPVAEAESAQTVASPVPADPAVAEAFVPVPAAAAPASVQSLREVAEAATEVITAAVKEFETVATAHVPEIAPAAIESPALEASAAAPTSAPEASPVVETQAETPLEELPVPAAETASEEAASVETKPEAAESEIPPAVEESPRTEEPTGQSSPASAPEVAATATAVAEDAPQVSEPVETAASAPDEKKQDAVEKDESDIAATTAAAWASWHRIRESDSNSAHHSQSENSDSQDAAAMAVAAGAEKSPGEADSESDPAIASIVDSVLANLRPKIVQEISRKLGKK